MKRLLLIALMITGAAQAQQTFVKGYVVELSGDTLRGEIKINPKKELDLYSKVAFKEANGLQKTYKPAKLKAYSFDNFVFVTGKNDDEYVFFKVLSTGELDLYALQYEVLQMNDIKVKHDYFMKKKDGDEFVKIRHGRFKKQLAEEMAKASHLVKEMEENKDLELENIPQVFDQYNTWAKAQSNK